MAKVMLVEDDNNLREIYEARLQAEGYTIVSAKDGEEALVVAKQEKPDLIISDVMMPKISGFEMLDILRNTDGLKTVKVVMLTALGQTDDQQRADKLGADRYLVKSQVTLEDIVKVAHELLEDGAPAAPSAASVTPSPAPAQTATPAVSPAPPSAPAASDDSAADDIAQSTSQESATVDAQIENFVEGASSEPTPVAPATPAATGDVIQGVAGEPDPAPVPPSANPTDDKLMADAVKTLETSAAEPQVEVSTVAPTVQPAPKEQAEEPAKPQNDAVTVAHKKVIQPIDSGPKQDINSLVALEEAKEAAAAPPPAPTVTIADSDSGPTIQPLGKPPMAAASDDQVNPQASEQPSGAPPAPASPDTGSTPPSDDPNSIAL